MNTTVLEIKNDIAYDFLENLERMRLIRIVRHEKRPHTRQKLSNRFAGALHLSDEQYEQMQNELIQMRGEWERNIC